MGITREQAERAIHVGMCAFRAIILAVMEKPKECNCFSTSWARRGCPVHGENAKECNCCAVAPGVSESFSYSTPCPVHGEKEKAPQQRDWRKEIEVGDIIFGATEGTALFISEPEVLSSNRSILGFISSFRLVSKREDRLSDGFERIGHEEDGMWPLREDLDKTWYFSCNAIGGIDAAYQARNDFRRVYACKEKP